MATTADSPTGEQCLVARASGVQAEDCMAAIAAGDGREIFEFGDAGRVRSAATGHCLVVADGDMASGGRVGLEECHGAAGAGDGRSAWMPAPGAGLQARHFGGHCLGFARGAATLTDCRGDAGQSLGGDPLALVAVPDVDASRAAAARDTAVLLVAAVARQPRLLAELRRAVPASGACKLAAVSLNSTRADAAMSVIGRRSRTAAAVDGAAERAVSETCPALGVDMGAVHAAIADGVHAVGGSAWQA